jgi:hypothetical protein
MPDNLSTLIVNQTSPKRQSRCEKCGAHLEVLREMLSDDKYSDNFWTAINMLENCSGCKSYFAHQLGGK